MNLEERIRAFTILGQTIRNILDGKSDQFSDQLNILIEKQQLINPWFTPANVTKALRAIADEMTEDILCRWTSAYPELNEERKPLRAGIIMAGNIPLVGFQDFLAVLISGNNLIAKTSSKDSELIPYISQILCSINPAFSDKIEFTDSILTNFDVVIATGSNNSARYFEYYFNKYPHIIRKNRCSVAILEGNESAAELQGLGNDIFSYFGLGCRNVSKLFLPAGYDIPGLLKNFEHYSYFGNHHKYANNYDFNKAVYIVNKEKFHDTGYLLIREDKSFFSPVSVLFYERYISMDFITHLTDRQVDEIQCIIGKKYIPFGKAQSPHPWDYSDGIDTIHFLLKKKSSGIS
jgi:hypothetical protein